MAPRGRAAAAVKEEAVEDTTSEDYKEFQDQVVELKDAGSSWAEVASELDTGVGRCILAYMRAKVKPSEMIKYTDDDDLATKIVAARDEDSLSWGDIMVRTGCSESKVRRLYTEASGVDTIGLRIGKGGRHPGGADGENGSSNGATTAAPRGSSRAARKTAEAEEASSGAVDLPNPKQTPYSEWTLAQLKTKFNGATAVYKNSAGKITRVGVKTVRKMDKGELTFVDVDGATHTIASISIISSTRK